MAAGSSGSEYFEHHEAEKQWLGVRTPLERVRAPSLLSSASLLPLCSLSGFNLFESWGAPVGLSFLDSSFFLKRSWEFLFFYNKDQKKTGF